MIISHHGAEYFKITQGDLTLALNPQSKMSADITLFSGVDRSETAEKSGFIITGPGEYEIKDIFVKGFSTRDNEIFKTTYLISFEGIKLCFLGAVQAVEDIEDVDILFIPVGTDPSAAYKLAVSLEPAVIIPMKYDEKTLAQFVKEGGEKVVPIDKFVVKKKDLEGKEGEIAVLKEE